MAREFYCTDCKEWQPVRDESVRGSRIAHAAMHDKQRSIFATPDLLALDAEMEFFYHVE